MSKTNRGWLAVAAALAVGASGIAWADDGGDNGMNPMYGDSYATLEGQGHNAGAPRMAPQGAFAAHEMDGRTTPLMAQMHESQQRMAEQTRHNWDAMVQKAHAMTDKMRTALSTQTTTATGATESTTTPTQSPISSGYRIAPVNPKGQAPTVVGPSGG
jgi:hypothetical protein